MELIHGNPAVLYSDIEDGWPGTGNIDADPCFVDSDANDYHLLPTSPCIDTGDPNYLAGPNETDLDGNPRIIDGRIDMGAYEYNPLLSAEVDIDPDTLNLASKGRWITCYIWLPEDCNVADIDPNSVCLEDDTGGEPVWAEQVLLDEEDQVAIARFSRLEVQGILNVGDVELTISGELTDGTGFEAADTIRVIDKGGRKSAK